MKIRLKKRMRLSGTFHSQGEVLDLPTPRARGLISAEWAESVTDRPESDGEEYYVRGRPLSALPPVTARVAIVVPCYNSRVCVQPLRQSLRAHSPSASVTFVSDGDGIYGDADREIVLPENTGFAHACNVGVNAVLRTAGSNGGSKGSTVQPLNLQPSFPEYLCLLNADVEVTPGWLEPLVQWLDDYPDTAIVAPRIDRFDGCIDSLGSCWHHRMRNYVHVGGRHHHPEADRAYIERNMATFACVLIRRTVWEEVGGLDEAYVRAYWEDSDFCMKVRKRGHRIFVIPKSIIKHHVGHSGAAGNQFAGHNRALFTKRWIDTGFVRDIERELRNAGPPKYRVLVRRRGARGDVFLATPILLNLFYRREDAEITVETDCPEVLVNNPHVAHIVTSANGNTFARTIDLNNAYERQPTTHILDAYAQAAGLKRRGLGSLWPEIHPTLEDSEAAERIALSIGPFVVVHPGPCSWPSRLWLYGRWHEVEEELRAKGLAPVHIDTRHSPTANAALIARAQAFIGIDSFPAHLAQAVNTPAVILFGVTDPQYRVWGGSVTPLFAKDKVDCAGCHHRMPAPRIRTNCKLTTGVPPCMKAITVDMVMEALDGFNVSALSRKDAKIAKNGKKGRFNS